MVIMVYDSDDDTVMDVKLFKMFGLHQLIWYTPTNGSVNWYRTVMLAALWLSTVVQCMQIFRLYLEIKHIQLFTYTLMLITSGMIFIIKGFVMITNAEKVLAVLHATRYTFTSCGHQNPSLLHRCREWLKFWLRPFFILIWSTMLLWDLVPWFAKQYVEFIKLDGTIGHYRTSTFNFWYPVSESMYNWLPVWAITYTIEAFIGYTYVMCLFLFDGFLVTMCITLNAQFHTLSAAYYALGHQSHHNQKHFSSKFVFCQLYIFVEV